MYAAAAVSVGIIALPASCRAEAGSGVPIARIKQSVICCPLEEIVLDGWASVDIDGEVEEWYWDLDGDNDVDTVTTTGEVRFVAPLESKLFSVALLVKDNDGNVSEPYSVSVHVMDSPPKVTLCPDTTVKVGVRVSFDPKVTSYCSSIELYEWDFDDDGSIEYKSRENGVTSRVYHKAGAYRARFKITDSLNREAGGIRTITVTASQPR